MTIISRPFVEQHHSYRAMYLAFHILMLMPAFLALATRATDQRDAGGTMDPNRQHRVSFVILRNNHKSIVFISVVVVLEKRSVMGLVILMSF